MLRRAFLNTLAALPVAGRLAPRVEPRLPHDRHVMFWHYFWGACDSGRGLSTDRARRWAVNGMRFEVTTHEEAVHALKLAYEGHLDWDDMPVKWREYIDTIDLAYNSTDQERRAAAVEELDRFFDRYD